MKRGCLNLHSGPGGSLTSVCADLEAIWAYAIQTCLDIPIRSLQVLQTGYSSLATIVVEKAFKTNCMYWFKLPSLTGQKHSKTVQGLRDKIPTFFHKILRTRY